MKEIQDHAIGKSLTRPKEQIQNRNSRVRKGDINQNRSEDKKARAQRGKVEKRPGKKGAGTLGALLDKRSLNVARTFLASDLKWGQNPEKRNYTARGKRAVQSSSGYEKGGMYPMNVNQLHH